MFEPVEQGAIVGVLGEGTLLVHPHEHRLR